MVALGYQTRLGAWVDGLMRNENRWALLALFIALPLAAALNDAYATSRLGKRVTEDQSRSAYLLSIEYDEDRINARILNTPLREACESLAQKSGVRCVLNPTVAALPVSATAIGLPLREAIQKILAGFSYAIYPAAGTGTLIVNVLAKRQETGSNNPGIAAPNESVSRVPPNAPFPEPIAEMPQSFQDAQPVEMESGPGMPSESHWDSQAREQDYHRGML